MKTSRTVYPDQPAADYNVFMANVRTAVKKRLREEEETDECLYCGREGKHPFCDNRCRREYYFDNNN